MRAASSSSIAAPPAGRVLATPSTNANARRRRSPRPPPRRTSPRSNSASLRGQASQSPAQTGSGSSSSALATASTGPLSARGADLMNRTASEQRAFARQRELWMNIRVTHRNYQDAAASQRPAEAARLYKMLEKHCADFNKVTFEAIHGRKTLRHYWNQWKLSREARSLEQECAQIIELRRRQRLLGTMLDGWRRASAAVAAGANDVTKIAHEDDRRRASKHSSSRSDHGRASTDRRSGEPHSVGSTDIEDDSMDSDDDRTVQQEPSRRGLANAIDAGISFGGTPRAVQAAENVSMDLTPSRLQALEQRMWWQFHEQCRVMRGEHAQQVALLHRDLIAKHKEAERKLHEDFENRTRSDTQRRIEELRRKERDLFEKEAADFRASLQKDIDYVESMAAEFELKAEKALAERRKQLAEERRNAVQKLYKKQQQELNELKDSLNSDLRVDVMKRNSAALKAAIAQETQRLEDEAESLIAEARTERDVELERIRESDPEDLWRSSTRGKELLEQHRGLLDQVASEKRAWAAELKDLELNEQQQLTLSQRIFGDERRRHEAEVAQLKDRFQRTVRCLRDGTFQQRIDTAVGGLLDRCRTLLPSNDERGAGNQEAPQLANGNLSTVPRPHTDPVQNNRAKTALCAGDSRRRIGGVRLGNTVGGGEYLRRYGREWEGDSLEMAPAATAYGHDQDDELLE